MHSLHMSKHTAPVLPALRDVTDLSCRHSQIQDGGLRGPDAAEATLTLTSHRWSMQFMLFASKTHIRILCSSSTLL